jgi:hypothetical protein
MLRLGLLLVLLWVQPSGWQPLGDALNVTDAFQSSDLHMTLDTDGLPVLVWSEMGASYVRRWDGAAWQDVGGALPSANTAMPNTHPFDIAANADGEIAVAWLDYPPMERRDENLPNPLYVGVSDGGEWQMLGGALNRFEALPGKSLSGGVVDAAVIDSPDGWIAAWREFDANSVPHILAARWDGAAWQPLGDTVSGGEVADEAGEDVEANFTAREADGFIDTWLELAIVDGQPTIAWVDVPETGSFTSPRIVRVTQWDGETWNDAPMFPVEADMLDSMASSGDTLYIATRQNEATNPIYRLTSNGWQVVDYPAPSGEDPFSVALGGAPRGSVVSAYLANGLQASRLDNGEMVSLTDAPLATMIDGMFNSDDIAAAAWGSSVYAAWIEASENGYMVRVAMYGN